MRKNKWLIILSVLVLQAFLTPSCGAGGAAPTATPVPLIEYRIPKPEYLGTLNGRVLTTINLTTGASVIRGFGVTLDSGEDVNAYSSASLLNIMKAGDRVVLTPANHEEFKWMVTEVNPRIMPPPIMSGVNGSLLLDMKIDDMLEMDEAVWVVGEDANGNKLLSRLDTGTAQVTSTTPIVEDKKRIYTRMKAGDDKLWVLTGKDLYAFDPVALQVVDKWSFESITSLLAVQDGIAWFEYKQTGEANYHLIRYDLQSRKELSDTSVMVNGTLALDETNYWLTTKDMKEGTSAATGKKVISEVYVVARVDPKTGAILNTITYTNYRAGFSLTPAQGSVWLPLDDGYIYQISKDSQELVAIFPIVHIHESTLGRDVKLSGIDFGAGALWVGHPASGSLLRIDPDTKNVTHVFSADGEVSHPQFGGDRVWMIVGGNTIAWVDTQALGSNK